MGIGACTRYAQDLGFECEGQVLAMSVNVSGRGLLKSVTSVPAGGYGMDVTRKSTRAGSEVTERRKTLWISFTQNRFSSFGNSGNHLLQARCHGGISGGLRGQTPLLLPGALFSVSTYTSL